MTITHIDKKPEQFARIIISNSNIYLINAGSVNINVELSKDIFFQPIMTPIELLIRIRTAQPYSKDLINRCIDFFNDCEAELKDGIFEIIYNVLSIRDTLDINLDKI